MKKYDVLKKIIAMCVIVLICFSNGLNARILASENNMEEENGELIIDSNDCKEINSISKLDIDSSDYNETKNDSKKDIDAAEYKEITTDDEPEVEPIQRVIIHDDRIPEPTNSLVSKNVCYITALIGNELSQGTGFLIGPNTVATSAHIIYNTDLNSLCTSSTIRIGNNVAHGVFYSYDPDYSSTRDSKDDWALIELDQPLGNSLGYFNISTNAYVGQELYLSGFHEDLYGLYTGNGTIVNFIESGKVIEHDCDSVKGASGSPLYDRSSHIAYGIQSAEYLDGTMLNLATKIDPFIYQNMISARVQYGLPNHGYIDAVTNSEIRGWAIDPTTVCTRYMQKFVDTYIYDSNGNQMTGIRKKAELFRGDVGYHAFSTPISWLKYKPGIYTINSYAIGINGQNILLNHSGITYTVRPSTGHVDTVNSTKVAGWVYKPDAPNEKINARIYFFNADTGVKIHEKSVVAGNYRVDLENAGIGNGEHGFVYNINLNSMPANRIRVEVYAADGSGSVPLIYSGIYTK